MREPLIKELINILPQEGKVTGIVIRPNRKQLPEYVEKVMAEKGQGLIGDHFKSKSNRREVTLIQEEHLEVVTSMLETEATLELTRRNIAVRGINLLALKGQKFQIGAAILEGTGECHPCSRMEENLGPGGYNTMRGHGGITARILVSGKIRVGDAVTRLESSIDH
jgi:MOSC domain-containing protein YiiM